MGGPGGLGVVGMTEEIADGLYLRLDGTTVPTADIGFGGFSATNVLNIVGDGSGIITNFAYIYEGGTVLSNKYLRLDGGNEPTADIGWGGYDLTDVGSMTLTNTFTSPYLIAEDGVVGITNGLNTAAHIFSVWDVAGTENFWVNGNAQFGVGNTVIQNNQIGNSSGSFVIISDDATSIRTGTGDNDISLQLGGTLNVQDRDDSYNLRVMIDSSTGETIWYDNAEAVFSTNNATEFTHVGGIKNRGHHIDKRTDAGAADYNPSALTIDYIITANNTAAARAIVISSEDVASGTTDDPRIFVIKDEYQWATTNNLSISLESGGTIDGTLTNTINSSGNAINLYIDGVNGHIF